MQFLSQAVGRWPSGGSWDGLGIGASWRNLAGQKRYRQTGMLHERTEVPRLSSPSKFAPKAHARKASGLRPSARRDCVVWRIRSVGSPQVPCKRTDSTCTRFTDRRAVPAPELLRGSRPNDKGGLLRQL